jgi:hypothetical protein
MPIDQGHDFAGFAVAVQAQEAYIAVCGIGHHGLHGNRAKKYVTNP